MKLLALLFAYAFQTVTAEKARLDRSIASTVSPECFQCDDQQNYVTDLDACLPASTGKAWYLFGDSHGAQARDKWRMASGSNVLYTGGCSDCSLKGPGWSDDIWQKILGRLEHTLKPADVVILEEWWDPNDKVENPFNIKSVFPSRLAALYDLTSKKQAKLVVVGDEAPWGSFQRPNTEASQASYRKAVSNLVGKSNFFFFDILDYQCQDGRCGPTWPGKPRVPALMDSHHLSEGALSELVPHMKAFLESHHLL